MGYIDDLIKHETINSSNGVYGNNVNIENDEIFDRIAESTEEHYGNTQTGLGYNLNELGDKDKYNDLGLSQNVQLLESKRTGELDKLLAEQQSSFDKFKNAIAQTLISEVALGTVKGVSDLVDIIGGAVFRSDNDYSNPVSQYLGQLQEDFKNYAPIYSDPDKNIANGGLLDAGWWASNIPSVMSSLTLLIPSTGITKGLGLLGKTINAATKGKLGAFGRNAYKVITGAGKAKSLEEAEKLNGFTKWLNSSNTTAAMSRMAETGFNATLMRTMENYQEAHQVYDDMKNKALDKFNSMTDEEYAQFINSQADKLEGVDTTDKEAVANKLAKDSADRTFTLDYANTIFDVIQLYALRNPIKLLKNMRSNAAINAAQRQSMTAIGKAATTDAIENVGIAATAKKLGRGVGQFLKDSKHVIDAELSEGVEEAVNYIAQEEGMHYGNVALGEDVENGFTSRLSSYMRSPELYDAAFWGVLGGVVFQGLGSGLNRLSVAAERYNQQRKKKGDSKTGEGLNYDTFQELFETSENKRRIADINKRTDDFNTLVSQLNMIEPENGGVGQDPFNQDENGNPIQLETETEKTIAKERAISDYITGMTFRAMDNGNFDMLKAYLQDSNIRQALEEVTGNEGDGGAFIDSCVRRMDDIAEKYSNNLIALSNIARNVNIASESTIPVEYLQIIARDNTAAQVKLEDLNSRIATYETSIENKKAVYGDKLDQSLNYKDAVQLVVLTQQLSNLKAEKAKIESSKDNQGIGRAIELDRVNKKIDIIEDMISGQSTLSNSDALTRLIYSTIRSNLINDKEAYTSNLESLMAGDIKAIIGEKNSKKFVTTDEELMKVLGEDRTSGSYRTLATDIDAVFEGAYGLNKIDTRFGDDYTALAALNIEKAILNENVIMNEANLQKRVNELHNEINDARKKAIDKSVKTLLDLAKLYGRDNIRNNLADGTAITWRNEADKKKYDDALEILNLSSGSNQQLYDDIQYAIIMDEFIETAQNAANPAVNESGENSSTFEKTELATPSPSVNNRSAEEQKTNTKEEKPLNEGIINKNKQEQKQNQNNINIDISKFNLIPDNPKTFGKGNKHYKIIYDNKEIGDLSLDEYNTANDSIKGVYLYENYRNKGLGKGLYKYLNKRANEKGRVLYSDEFEISDAAKRVWESLKKEGLAEYIPNSRNIFIGYRFKNNSTVSPTGGQESKPSTKVDEFGNPIADTNRMAIEDEITKELSTAARNAINNNSNVIVAINDKIQELDTKYGSDEGYKKHINRMANFIAKRASKKDLTVDVANVAILASSVTEQGGKYHFPEEFIKAAQKFADDFLKAVNAKEFNGKKVVSFESMLRFANNQMEDSTTADYIYKSLKNWFESKTDKYIVLDNMDSAGIIQRAGMSDRTLANERIGATNIFRVQIDKFLNNAASKAAIDKINAGDVLNAKVVNGDIILTVGNVEIGRLPQPEIDSSTGGFKKTNDGWITDVRLANGQVYSELRGVWEDILLKQSPINDKINNYIYQIIAANKVNDDTKPIIDAIEKDVDLKNFFDKLKVRNVVDKKANSVELIEGLVNIWNYIDLTNPDASERAADINYSLDLWFNKLYDTYSAVNNAIAVGVDKLQFTVSKITDGDVIQVAANDNEGYDKCTLGNGNEAFANVDNVQLGAIKPESVGVIQTTDNQAISQPKGSAGSIWAILPNRSGIPGIVRGHALKFIDIDNNINSTSAGRIRQAISKEFERRIKEFVQDNIDSDVKFNELVQFIDLVFGNNTSTPLLAPIKGGKFNVKKYGNERIIIGWQNNDGSFSNFTINFVNRQYNTEKLGYKDVENVNSFIDDFKHTVLANAMFNVDFRYLDSDSGSTNISGLATRDKDGNFVITIPNGTDTSLVETFPSYKHFLMQGGGARWNTKNVNGNNFEPHSNNQLRNQILNVSIETKTTRPVEENVDTTITPETINDGTAITTLLEKRFGKDSPAIKQLQKAGLIPSQITHTSETLDKGGHPSNIWTVLSKKKIYVNNEFIKVMESNPDVALRKLIHEQLHLKLHSKGNRRKELLNRIQEIYNDFEKSLNREGVDEHIKEYLFNHIDNPQEKLEEFLVESLTNRELASYLNTVDATAPTEKTKQSIFDKILKLLADIFDWKVSEGSLYEKELRILQGYTTEEINESTQDNQTQNTSEVEEIEEDDNFDEEDYDGMAASVNEVSTSPISKEMQDIKLEAIQNGTFMKAPNGNPTNLTERQWLQVRTKAFKNWFGNWINDPANASKVVDENGEPLVVYHHRKTELTDFSKRTDNILPGMYFSKKSLTWFGPVQIMAFLNIKNPVKDYHEDNLNQTDINNYKKAGIDGQFTTDFEDPTDTRILEYIVFDGNQIKSAADNNGEFSTENDDIRASSVQETTTPTLNQFVETLPLEERIEFNKLLLDSTISIKCS